MRRSSIQTSLRKRNNVALAYGFALVLLVVAMFLGVAVGSVPISFATILDVCAAQFFPRQFASEADPMVANIVWYIRLPRVVLAALVGASLSLAGAAFQGLLKNPLADPYTLGVSSGASVGAVVVLFFGLSLPLFGSFTLPFVSIIAGFVTLLAVLAFARFVERALSVQTIVLTGIIFSSFCGSLISLMIALTGEELRQIIGWLLGSVAMRGWEYVALLVPFFAFGAAILLANGKELNALAFGEETAQQLGVDVRLRKMAILAGASLLTGAAVAVSGTIGFVGLVMPHLTRLLWGPDHRHLLPLAMLHGGAFLAMADLAARTIVAPQELPIGVITALIGAPVFAVVFWQQRKRGKQG